MMKDIGPFGFQLIGEEGPDVMHFAEFGVVMMPDLLQPDWLFGLIFFFLAVRIYQF